MKALSFALTCCSLVLLNSTAFSAPVTTTDYDSSNLAGTSNEPASFTSPTGPPTEPSQQLPSAPLTPYERQQNNDRESYKKRKRERVALNPPNPAPNQRYRWEELENESVTDYTSRVTRLNKELRELEKAFAVAQPPPVYSWTPRVGQSPPEDVWTPTPTNIHDLETVLLRHGIIKSSESNSALPSHRTRTHNDPAMPDFATLLRLHGILEADSTHPFGRNSDSLGGTRAQPAPAIIDLTQDSDSDSERTHSDYTPHHLGSN